MLTINLFTTPNANTTYQIIEEGLFNKQYFEDYFADITNDVDYFIGKAKKEFEKLIENSYNKKNLYININECYNLNIVNELLFDYDLEIKDNVLNRMIYDAKKCFIDGNKLIAVQQICNALDRVKLLGKKEEMSKRERSEVLAEKIAKGIVKARFITEFDQLSRIYNNDNYIRHGDGNKVEIHNEDNLNYLFFRVYSLVNLCISKIKDEIEEVKEDKE